MIQTTELNPDLQELQRLRPVIDAPLLATYYQLEYNGSKIAKATGYSHQYISQKTKELRKYVVPLLRGNAYAAFVQKYMAMRFQEEVEHILDTCGKNGKKEFKAAHILPLNTAGCQSIDKGRLYDGESTENRSIAIIDGSLSDLDKHEKEIMTKLSLVTGEVIDV